MEVSKANIDQSVGAVLADTSTKVSAEAAPTGSKKCAFCSRVFERNPNTHNLAWSKRKYCSRNCTSKAKIVLRSPKTCETCGKTFIRHWGSKPQFEKTRFCSRKCWASWNSSRKLDSHECSGCGDVLISNKNWAKCNQSSNKPNYICRTCENTRKRKSYAEKQGVPFDEYEQKRISREENRNRPKCRKCKEAIKLGENWRAGKGNYICVPCAAIQNKEYREDPKNEYGLKRWTAKTGRPPEGYEVMQLRRKENAEGAPHCIGCGELLISGKNCKETALRRHDYVCVTCSKKRYSKLDNASRKESVCEGCGRTYLAREGQRFCSRACASNSPEFKAIASKTAKANISKDPDKWRQICHIAGKRRQELYPELTVKVARETIKKTFQKYPDLPSRAGKIGGRKTAESGKLFNTCVQRLTFGACGIESHKHRSKLEIAECEKLQCIYECAKINSSVHVGRIEIDFIIGDNPKDSTTWEKAIEIHDSYWDKLNGISNYRGERTSKLLAAGVQCPIEIIVVSRGHYYRE